MKFIDSFIQYSGEHPDDLLLDDCAGEKVTAQQLDRISGQV